MERKITDKQLGLLLVTGLSLVIGSIWWLKGLAAAALTLGVVLVVGAWGLA